MNIVKIADQSPKYPVMTGAGTMRMQTGNIFEQEEQTIVIMNKRQPSLLFCIIMDILGYATYTIPVIGEVADIIWAPLSAVIFLASFGGWKGALGGLGNLIEELLPGTDFIPSFTIMWFLQQHKQKRNLPPRTPARV